MKKLYSVFLALVLCATGVSASVLDGMKVPDRLKNVPAAAPMKAAASADDEWTEWSAFGTGTFTMDDGMEIFLGETGYQGDHTGIQVDCRTNAADPQVQQYRFRGVFNNADIVADYNGATGLLTVQPQLINIDYYGMADCPLKAVDAATLWRVVGPGAGYGEEDIEFMYGMYSSYNYFIPTLGRFYIYFALIYDGLNDAAGLVDCQLQLDGYPDFTPAIGMEKYMSPSDAKATISFPEETAYALYAVSNRPHTQATLDYILENGETPDMIYKVEAPGEISLPNGVHNKISDLIVITYDDKGNALEMNSQFFTVVDDEADKWTSIGQAGIYTEMLEKTVFESEGNDYTVELQQSKDNADLVRVVDLYGEQSPLTSPAQVHSAMRHYMVFDLSDPAMVQVAHTDLGIDMGGGSFYVYAVATAQGYRGKTPEEIKEKYPCGTYSDGILEFPEGALEMLCDDFSVFGGTAGAAYPCGKFQLDLDGIAGIGNITVDADAPVRYYNLQGMEVKNPAKGIYIRCQGAKSTKVVF